MSTFFGYKVLMVAVLAIPVVALVTFALVSPSDELLTYEQHYRAGLELHEQGRLNEAIAGYSEAINLNSAHVKAYSKRGGAYFALGEFRQALPDYNEAIQLKSLLLYGLGSQKYSRSEARHPRSLCRAGNGLHRARQRHRSSARPKPGAGPWLRTHSGDSGHG